MKTLVQSLFAVSALAFAAQAAAQVTVYENEGFSGRSYTTQSRVPDAQRTPLNNTTSSIIVVGQRWEVCEDARFRGRCMVFRPGQYPSLTAMGLNDNITSLRPLRADEQIAEANYAPMPVVAQDYRRRNRERLFDADVTSVRAVVGTPAQRCWIEREQLPAQQQSAQGAAAAAIIGGIMGHQVGPARQDVRRCDSNPAQATPNYWDVVYQFRGQEHRVQMATPPGRTITVNNRGEPRA